VPSLAALLLHQALAIDAVAPSGDERVRQPLKIRYGPLDRQHAPAEVER
jgi:hypothetical protein